MDPEYPIFSTTLCYLERDDAYLMLHRIKKQDDYNHDKWVGVGGKFERFESPEDCLVREVREETGLTLTRWRCRGLLTFVWGNMTEFIHLYTADGWQGEMVQGEYSDVFQEMMQRAIDKATENIRQNPQVARLTQALANAYGVDTDDMDGLIEAVENGRVKDEKYYEDLAQQRGVSVKTARELDKMESDLKRSNTRNAQLQAMQQEATRQQRVSQIQAQWEAQAAQLKTQYPDFELQEVLANEQVADLMRRGVSLPDAYRAAYFDHIMQQATAQTAQKVEQGVAARIQQRASRPGENGTRPGGAVTTHVDVASMSRRQLEDLERRARRGEKITL